MKMQFQKTNLRELAHQWFGNQITMRWWDDLWLSDSFAEAMSYIAIGRIEKLAYLKDALEVSFLHDKMMGYNLDMLNTTHPVQSGVKNANEATTAFDGISYGKGAAWLQQVYKLVGHETMKTALHDYFRLFKGRNIEFSDFVKTLAQAYHWSDKEIDMGENFDFAAWSNTWLTTSGVNIIEPVIELANGAESTYGFIKQLNITQKAPPIGDNHLREFVMDIVFYDNYMHQSVVKNVIVKA